MPRLSEKQLIEKRNAFIHQLTSFEKLLNNFENCTLSETDIETVSRRLKRIQENAYTYENTQTSIEHQSSCIEEEFRIRIEIEALIDELSSIASVLIKPQMSQSFNQSINIDPQSVPNVKLPKVDLPTFNGDFTKWRPFEDAFDALINKNDSIPEVQKLCYLRSALRDDALSAIESLETTATNYKVAYKILKDRFNQHRRIVFAHTKGLINMQGSSLKSVANYLEQYLRSLEALKISTNNFEAFLIPYVLTKLDKRTNTDWDLYVNNKFKSNEIPKCQDLIEYLLEKSYVIDGNRSQASSHVHQQKSKFVSKSFTNAAVITPTCIVCSKEHYINQCKEFLDKTVNDRFNIVKSLRLCINCLHKGHNVKECKSSRCKKCNMAHNTLLHFEKAKISQNDPSSSTVANCNTIKSNLTLLCTAQIKILDKFQNAHSARVLLDSGSQTHFISTSLVNKLKLNSHKINHEITGIGQTVSRIHNCVQTKIFSKTSSYTTNLSCLVLDSVTDNLPQVSFENQGFNLPPNVSLADEDFHISRPIDMLIGSPLVWDIMLDGQIEIENSNLKLRNTQFGWIVSGTVPIKQPNNQIFTCLSLNSQIEKFWQLENYKSPSKYLSVEEGLCESHFSKSVRRDHTGRFIVSIPFKETHFQLGDSRTQAQKRFFALENRLNKNPELKQMYVNFMNEYISLGHMTKVSNDIEINEYFLPHHGVFRNESTTTKLRVVFDGSAKSSTNVSLNDIQYAGPNIQSDIFSLLVRFRKHRFVVTADIEKMYRQVLIEPNQRHLQKIMWREISSQSLNCYKLNTVTYGTTSAPYLAVRCLVEIANIHKNEFPDASNIIIEDMYVDDLLTGSDDLSELISRCVEVSNILKSAGFLLRKWNSNNSELIHHFNLVVDNSEPNISMFSNETKTLGIIYNTQFDEFRYSFKSPECRSIYTKRSILSQTAQLFDPLGLLSPLTVIPKLIIQQLWKMKCNWDDPIPSNIFVDWERYLSFMQKIDTIKIKRHAVLSKYKYIEIHGFADASEKAYGACIYIKSIDQIGKINVELLTAKSRVAPVKQVTLPRLELCASNLLAHLYNRVKTILKITFDQTYLWTDSTIVLSWIQASPSRWKTFVANRVSEIQELTSIKYWHHVKSVDNPADLISRGLFPEGEDAHNLWWHGPIWLSCNNYPKEDFVCSTIPEERTNSKTFKITVNIDVLSKFSNLPKLIRVFSYCFRFINKVKKHCLYYGSIRTEERKETLKKLIKLAQRQAYPSDIESLEKDKQLNNNSPLLSLSPFIDNDGLLRVGGRLQNSNRGFQHNHQILLPNHHLTSLIASFYHKINLHCGPQQLLFSMRLIYWPIRGRTLTRKIVRECLTCFKSNPRPFIQFMGNLPKDRVTPSFPFAVTGVDFAGPFKGRDRRARGYKIFKTYVCLFICLSTKAIHLEVVSDLSTQAFLSALRRFISRRGKPLKIVSDNGTNFVGANSELKRLQREFASWVSEIDTILSNEGTEIKWEFIPARSPHIGGIWESNIKIMKRHLIRIVGQILLTHEEFETILLQIEAVLNSRPLYPASSNPNDLSPITPAHFLIGRPIVLAPEENFIDTPSNRLITYERMQQVTQQFWRRWKKEYINHLQTRNKWTKKNPQRLKEGLLVLLVDSNEPPATWRMGRILELFPGQDDIVRVVSIKTSNGVVKRAVSKICVIPNQ